MPQTPTRAAAPAPAYDHVCVNCRLAIVSRPVARAKTWVHCSSGQRWCFDDRQGFGQPTATPDLMAALEASLARTVT